MQPIQYAMNVPAALVTRATAKSPGRAEPGDVGMTMWFKVMVDGFAAGDLGRWSGCDGLSVRFERELARVGGAHLTRVVPTHLAYGDITLRRAMNTSASANVRTWLGNFATDWVNAQHTSQLGTSVTIELHSRLPSSPGGTPVARWELRDVLPVSWSAPNLSSAGGGVAIEELVLSHNGFLDLDDVSGSGGQPGRLRLSAAGSVLELELPEAVSRDRTVSLGRPAGLQLNNPAMTDPGKRGISCSAVLVEGADVIQRAEALLWSWQDPVPATARQSRNAGKDTTPTDQPEGSPQPVTVQLGTLKPFTAALRGLRVDYVRFTTTGAPSRARFTLTFEELILSEPRWTPVAPSTDALGTRRRGGSDPMRRPTIGTNWQQAPGGRP